MTRPARLCSPVAASVGVTSRTTEPGGTVLAVAEVVVAADEPVFAGHYPDFPLFPGVCVVECVRRAAVETAPEGAGRVLAALDSVRLLGPVFPGDAVTISLRWEHDERSGWSCAAKVDVGDCRVATVRLRLGDS